ncbi:H-NS histone family protein [Aliisedimentitalea scapharcae]|uniref:H-NS histone family protein n=1 Tax=Aliisedimentitalea scapharcae TaxID=1524259 RepID=A0ABZ2XW79_9RHOB|nr:H-NS histone family protein [Rhodobacteraceae bacterium M382]
MSVDLSNMSRHELAELRTKIDAAIAEAEVREKAAALQAVKDAAAEHGFTFEEIAKAANTGAGKRAKAAPKYRNPDNHEETWSGRGRKPQWIHAALTRGLDVSDLEI